LRINRWCRQTQVWLTQVGQVQVRVDVARSIQDRAKDVVAAGAQVGEEMSANRVKVGLVWPDRLRIGQRTAVVRDQVGEEMTANPSRARLGNLG
jgi:hypothetical protein